MGACGRNQAEGDRRPGMDGLEEVMSQLRRFSERKNTPRRLPDDLGGLRALAERQERRNSGRTGTWGRLGVRLSSARFKPGWRSPTRCAAEAQEANGAPALRFAQDPRLS